MLVPRGSLPDEINFKTTDKPTIPTKRTLAQHQSKKDSSNRRTGHLTNTLGMTPPRKLTSPIAFQNQPQESR